MRQRYVWENEALKKTVAEVAAKNDLRLVGPLCDILRFQDVEIEQIAEAALVTLLPRLKASDSRLLNAEQRQVLYQRLLGYNTPLVLAILKALEQISDEKALPYVEELWKGNYLAATSAPIIDAARDCLPALQQRIEVLRVGQDLLRASGSDVQPDTLLRPAMATHETEPQQLLRASHTDTL